MKKQLINFIIRTCEFSDADHCGPVLIGINLVAMLIGIMRGGMMGHWDEHPSLILILWRVTYNAIIIMAFVSFVFLIASEIYYWFGKLKTWTQHIKYRREQSE